MKTLNDITDAIRESFPSAPILYNAYSVADLLRQLYKECEHGDEEHRKWLKDKFEDFITKQIYK